MTETRTARLLRGTLVLYVLATLVLAPWDELAPAEGGSDPRPLWPADGYQHHNSTLRFEWSALPVEYLVMVFNSTGAEVVNITLIDETNYQTKRLVPDFYTWVAWYTPIDEALAEILASGIFSLNASAKQALEWDTVSVSYQFRLRAVDSSTVSTHEGVGLHVEVGDLEPGNIYRWQVRALDSNGHTTDWSLPRSVEVGTTQFLAFEVFSEWELALLLTGMILVVALQAGVFLAREEPE
ncbi:MAG: hypothetical protein MK363_23585 [Pseudomonas sp.]|nr:hypothetical protein [Pseudomonas sp.]